MPKYSYHCEKCNITYDKIHLMSEIHSVCDKCGEENSLNKIIYIKGQKLQMCIQLDSKRTETSLCLQI